MSCVVGVDDAINSKAETPIVGIDSTDAMKPVKQAPMVCPPLFSGTRFTAYGMFEANAAFPSRVTIRATGPDGPVVIEASPKAEESYVGDVIHKMAAKFLIRDLEDDQKEAEACALSLK